jgi:hypothetical protein
VEEARALFRYGRRISENEIYYSLVSRLLRDRLHLAESNVVVVSRRGTKDRKDALTDAIRRAQTNFQAKRGQRDFGPCTTTTGGLQAIVYFLWALQRL